MKARHLPFHFIIILALFGLMLVAPGCAMFNENPRETSGTSSTAAVTTANGQLVLELASGFNVACGTRQLGRTNAALSVAMTTERDKPILNAVIVQWEIADREAFKSVSDARSYFAAKAASKEASERAECRALLFNFTGRSNDVVWENPNTLDVFTLIIEVEKDGLVMDGVVSGRIGLAFENDQLIRFGGMQISDWRRRALGSTPVAAPPPPAPAPVQPTASTVTAGVGKPAESPTTRPADLGTVASVEPVAPPPPARLIASGPTPLPPPPQE